jgi:TraB/PrgY/gumN family
MERRCFEATLDHLEGDLDVMQQRAVAWSSGDLEDLAKLPMSDQLDVCRETLIASGASFRPDMADVKAKLRGAWLLAARNAIWSHRVSFAMLPMADLLGSDNYLDKLRAEGYSVDMPDSLNDSAD